MKNPDWMRDKMCSKVCISLGDIATLLDSLDLYYLLLISGTRWIRPRWKMQAKDYTLRVSLICDSLVCTHGYNDLMIHVSLASTLGPLLVSSVTTSTRLQPWGFFASKINDNNVKKFSYNENPLKTNSFFCTLSFLSLLLHLLTFSEDVIEILL